MSVAILLAAPLFAQEAPTQASAAPLPDAPSAVSQQSSSQQQDQQSQTPGPDVKLGESSKPEQNSPGEKGLEQPKRILWVIPNYRAVSADAKVPPLDPKGKFKLFVDDSFDYSTFVYVGFLTGLGVAQNSVPQFGDGADAAGKYYYHYFADQALGNFFTEFTLPIVFKEDPRYFTLGRGGFFKRSGYALTRLVVTRTDSGGTQPNFSEIIGNGAAAGIAGLYYPDQYRTWTKTGQRWGQQLALDGFFNVLKEFWPDISHSIFHQK